MYTVLTTFYCYNKKCMMHTSKITPATSPLFCNPYPAEHTLKLISMPHFQMCNILKFTQNSLVVLVPYLLTYSQQCFVTTLIMSYCVYGYVFWFNGFNRFMWFNMGRITKTITVWLKPLKQKTLPINTIWC